MTTRQCKFCCGRAEAQSATMGMTASPLVRWGIVCALCAITAGFLVSHLTTLDVEFMDVDIAGAPGHRDLSISHQRVFEFKMFNTLRIFWLSGGLGCVLAITLAFCSVFLTYAKILTMLLLWTVPLPHRITSTLLLGLDEAARWSFLDVFVAGLSQTGLRISMRGVFLVGSIDIGVGKQISAYVFSVTATCCVFLTQLLLHLHRVRLPALAIEPSLLYRYSCAKGVRLDRTSPSDQALLDVVDVVEREGADGEYGGGGGAAAGAGAPTPWAGRRLLHRCGTSTWTRAFAVLAALATLALTAVGCFSTVFTFKYGGVFARYMGSRGVVSHSGVGSGVNLASINYGASSPLWAIYYVVVMWGMVVFVMQCAVVVLALPLLVLRVPPRPRDDELSALQEVVETPQRNPREWGCGKGAATSARTRWRNRVDAKEFFLHAEQLASAWAGLDVFCVAVGIQLLSLDRIAVEILKVQPDNVKELLTTFCGDEDCVHIHTSFGRGYWLCVVAALAAHAIRIYARALTSDELRRAKSV